MVQEIYGNLWVTYKDVVGVNEKNHQSFVRGKILDFSPRSIRQALHLLPPDYMAEHYGNRVNRDQQLYQVLAEIYIQEPSGEWAWKADRTNLRAVTFFLWLGDGYTSSGGLSCLLAINPNALWTGSL
ncbi:hypothetical protein AHAS_Ahas17G0155800 [Arachis hypogaea]